MKKSKRIVAIVIISLLSILAFTMVGCVTDIGGGGGLLIDVNAKLKLTMYESSDNYALVPPRAIADSDAVTTKTLGAFDLKLLVDEVEVIPNKIDVFVSINKLLVKTVDDKYEDLDSGLVDYFIVTIIDNDGNIINPAFSEENVIGATKLKLNMKYTVKLSFNSEIKDEEYTDSIIKQLVGKDICVSALVFASIEV